MCEDIAPENCVGDQDEWFKDELCDDIGSQCVQHAGACCDGITGVCTDDVLPDDCTGTKQEWFKGVDCTDASVACTTDWFFKDYAPNDPDAGFMPDYDQNKDYDGVDGVNRERYYCGPVAVANSLWWFHNKFPTDNVVDPTATKWDLVEDLAHRMGTKHDSILAYYLIWNGSESSDPDMMESLGCKTSQFKGLMGDPDETEEDRMLARSSAKKHIAKIIAKIRRRSSRKNVNTAINNSNSMLEVR